jgi:hypothetical protein
LGIFGRRTKPSLTHHVAWTPEGDGATLLLFGDKTRHEWRWLFDPGIDPDDLLYVMQVFRSITKIEKAWGWPLTFPWIDASARSAQETADARASREAADVEAAREGDLNALVRTWRAGGEPVESPDDLVVGKTYVFAGDLAVYEGSYVGYRWDGTDVDFPNEHGEWFKFSSAESSEPGNVRMGRQAFMADSRSGRPYHAVVSIDAPAAEVATVYQQIRERYLRSETR